MAEKRDWCAQQAHEQILLVEGENDCHVVLALWQAYQRPPKESFGIFQCGGDDKNRLLKQLNSLIQSSLSGVETTRTLGVVMDADKPDVAARWQQIRDKLRHYPYAFPPTPAAEGTVIPPYEKDAPRLGFWLMPNNRDAGMLEDFLLELAEPEVLNQAKQCVSEAEQAGLTKFKKNHRSKAELHTYLAWRDEPGKPYGQALTAHALQAHTPIAEQFMAWLDRLFG